jgi:hypothetical protein
MVDGELSARHLVLACPVEPTAGQLNSSRSNQGLRAVYPARCPDHDERDPLAVLTGIITALDPSLPADAIASAAQRLFARRATCGG